MSLRRRGASLAVVAVTALTVAACGSSSNSSSSSSAASGGGSSTAAGSTGSSTTGSGSSSGKLTTMTVAFTPSSNAMAIPIGIKEGFFKQHGIAIKYGTAAATGAEQIAQILNGQITFGQGALTGVITAVSTGLGVQITNAQDEDFSANGQHAFGVIVSKSSGISSFKDLDGKTVAVNSIAGNWQVSLQAAVEADGGDPNGIKFVAIPFADQVAALKSGRVDAISSLQPFLSQLTSAGYVDVGDPQAAGFGGKTNSVVDVTFMSKKYIDANPTVVKNFVAAMTEATNWANSHPTQTKQFIEQVTKTPASVVNATPLPKYNTKVTTADVDGWSKLLVKYKVLKSAPSSADVLWSGAPK